MSMEQKCLVIGRRLQKMRRTRRLREAMEQRTPLDLTDMKRILEVGESAVSSITDEEYQQGRLIGKMILLLDDLQREPSPDADSLPDLAAEAALWV
jgi:hypothetical protein